MNLSAEVNRGEIATIVRLVDQSPCREFKLAIGDLRLELSKDGPSAPAPATRDPVAAPLGADAVPPPPATAVAQAAPKTAIDRIPVDGFKVVAPMLGIFYRAPAPGAPPFVEVGTRIEAGTTLCIIEVMKVMNTIKADRAGTVAAIYPENAAMIEFGETIMVLREEAGD